MRSQKRLSEIIKLPCVVCGRSPVDAAHSNQSLHNKGLGIKASDEFTVPLCAICHSAFDQFKLGTRSESEAMFEQWLEKTERIMNLKDQDDVF